MRISDWSSDVCSSDLVGDLGHVLHQAVEVHLVLCRAHHGGGAAGVGVGTVEQTVEFLVTHPLQPHLAELAAHFTDGPAWRGGTHNHHRAFTRLAQHQELGLGPGVWERSEERRVGKECVSKCYSRGWTTH